MIEKYTYSIDFVGLNIKLNRIKQGLTQEELAEILGVSRQTVYYWESGRRLPSLYQYFNICFQLDIQNFNLFSS